MQAQAQILSRGSLITPKLEAAPPWKPQQSDALRVAVPVSGQAKNLSRWSEAVRAGSIQQTLLSAFQIEFDPATETVWGMHLDKATSLRSSKPSLKTIDVFKLQKPAEADFVAQLKLVLQAAEQRESRFEEVLAQADFPWALWASTINLQPGRHRGTIELLKHALSFTSAIYHRVKHEFACVRPADRSPLVQPVLPTPEHGALPSGHATESFLMATLLPALLKQKDDSVLASYLNRLAEQIAQNRVIAGVHFPVDSQAGRALGTALARYLIRRAGGQAHGGIAWSGRGVLSKPFDRDQAFEPLAEGKGTIDADTLWAWLWQRAADEWKQ